MKEVMTVTIEDAKKITGNVLEIIRYQETERKIKNNEEDAIDWEADNFMEMAEFEKTQITKNQAKLKELKSKLNIADLELITVFSFYFQDGEGGKDLIDIFAK